MEGVSDADAAEARALEQARIRKERREAKIRANAGNRLNRITGLGGGVERGVCLDPSPRPYDKMVMDGPTDISLLLLLFRPSSSSTSSQR